MAVESTPLVAGEEAQPRRNSAVYVSFIFPALAGLLYGYDIGAASGAVVSFELDTPMTAIETSVLTSASLIGALVGSIIIFWVGQPLGRRREIIVASGFYLIGTAISMLAMGSAAYGLAVTGRIIYGFGIAFAMHAAPAYIAEIAPAELRGTLISLKEAFIVFGILLAYSVAAITEYTMDDQSKAWRIIWCPALVIALVVGVGMYTLPPSPRWLVSCGRREEATEALRLLRVDAELPLLRWLAVLGPAGPPPGQEEIEAEVEDMVASLALSQSSMSISKGVDAAAPQDVAKGSQVGFCDVMQDIRDLGAAPRALVTGFGLVLLQQFTGQPCVLYYIQAIFESAGFDPKDAALIDILVGGVKLLATLAAVPFVDRSGRVPLLQIGTFTMLVSLILLCSGFAVSPTVPGESMVTLEGAWVWVVIVAVLAYVIGYQVGFGPITWVMISECFPLQLRARALSAAATLNFSANLLLTLINGPIADTDSGQTILFGVFAGMCVVALAFVYFFVPETKGKTLEEIDTLMRRPFRGYG